jgi:N-acetylmannosamine-6-phosphate 2-epimerase/N-acetylmannosamine kinase
MSAPPILAIDLGGTKTLLGLVRGSECLETRHIRTLGDAGADAWLGALAEAAAPWRGIYATAAIAVTGRVAEGRWYSFNPDVLPVPAGFPLAAELSRRLDVPVYALNDAQAAAWGEYRFGAAQGCDMVFITVSTGIGGGIVLGGRLLTGHRGIAGHLGQYRSGAAVDTPWLEHLASGSALARDAAAAGHPTDAEGVFAAAASGADWAECLLDGAAARLGAACASLQAILDPDCIVIGGGVGLAPGFLARLRNHLATLPEVVRPDLRAAALGAMAGLLGVADVAVAPGMDKGGSG